MAEGDSSEDDRWKSVIERVKPAMVTLHGESLLNPDGGGAFTGIGSGFCVDADLGLILTNRHVVTRGPTTILVEWGSSREEQLGSVVFVDPVHDFAFVRFDPAGLKRTTPLALPLDPEGAQVGEQIRLIGADAGERLQVLQGTISRVDRPPPAYNAHQYRDFNTEYISAATSSSGGSSGSPIVNVHGRAVALNAGGATHAAGAMFLPLHRVQRALVAIQGGARFVPRGDLNALCTHVLASEAGRRGAPDSVLGVVASATSSGLVLTVGSLLRGGMSCDETRTAKEAQRAWGLPVAVTGRPAWAAEAAKEAVAEATDRLQAQARAAASGAAATDAAAAGPAGRRAPACATEPAAATHASTHLCEGDILMRVNGAPCTSLVQLDKALDDAMDAAVEAFGPPPTGQAFSPPPASGAASLEAASSKPFATEWERETAGHPAVSSVNWSVERIGPAPRPDSATSAAARTVPAAALPPPAGYITLDVWRLGDDAPAPGRSRGAGGKTKLPAQAAGRASADFVSVSNGRVVRVTLPVACAYSLQPRRLFEAGGSVLQTLPLSQCFAMEIPPGTPVVSSSGHMLAGALGSPGKGMHDVFRILKTLEGSQIKSLADATASLIGMANGRTFSMGLVGLISPDAPPMLNSFTMTRQVGACRILAYSSPDALGGGGPACFDGWHQCRLPRERALSAAGVAALRLALRGEELQRTAGALLDGEADSSSKSDAAPAAPQAPPDQRAAAQGAAPGSQSPQVPGGDSVPRATLADIQKADAEPETPLGTALRLAAEALRHPPALAMEAIARLLLPEAMQADSDGAAGASVGVAEGSGADAGGRRGEGGGSGGCGRRRRRGDGGSRSRLGGVPLKLLTKEEADARRDAKLLLRRRLGSTHSARELHPVVSRASLCLLEVTCCPQLPVDGIIQFRTSFRHPGMGVLVHRRMGLLLVSAGEAPVLFCHVLVGLGPLQVPGRVVFVHPEQGWAVVQADIAAQPWADLVVEAAVSRTGMPVDGERAMMGSAEYRPTAMGAIAAAGFARSVVQVLPLGLLLATPIDWTLQRLARSALTLSGATPLTSSRAPTSSFFALGQRQSRLQLRVVPHIRGPFARSTTSMSVPSFQWGSFSAPRVVSLESVAGPQGVLDNHAAGAYFDNSGSLVGLFLPNVGSRFALSSDLFADALHQIILRMGAAPLLRPPSGAHGGPALSPEHAGTIGGGGGDDDNDDDGIGEDEVSARAPLHTRVPDLELRSLGVVLGIMPARDALAILRLPRDVRRRLLQSGTARSTNIVSVTSASRDHDGAAPIPPGCSGQMIPGESWGRLRDGDCILDILPSPPGIEDVDPAIESCCQGAKGGLSVRWKPAASGGAARPSATDVLLPVWLAERHHSALDNRHVDASTAQLAPRPVQEAVRRSERRLQVDGGAAPLRPVSAATALRLAGLDPCPALPVPVHSVRELAIRAQRAPFLRLRILREGRVAVVRVPTQPVLPRGADVKDVLVWSGLVLHDAGLPLRRTAQPPTIVLPDPTGAHPRGVPVPCRLVIARTIPGSSASRLGGTPLAWLTAIGGKPTPDVRTAARIVAALPDREAVRLDSVSCVGGQRHTHSVRPCNFTHPPQRMVQTAPHFEWVTVPLTAEVAGSGSHPAPLGEARSAGPSADRLEAARAAQAAVDAAARAASEAAAQASVAVPGPAARPAPQAGGDSAAASGGADASAAAEGDAEGEGKGDGEVAPALVRMSSLSYAPSPTSHAVAVRAGPGGLPAARSGVRSLREVTVADVDPSRQRIVVLPCGGGGYQVLLATGPTASAVHAACRLLSLPLVAVASQAGVRAAPPAWLLQQGEGLADTSHLFKVRPRLVARDDGADWEPDAARGDCADDDAAAAADWAAEGGTLMVVGGVSVEQVSLVEPPAAPPARMRSSAARELQELFERAQRQASPEQLRAVFSSVAVCCTGAGAVLAWSGLVYGAWLLSDKHATTRSAKLWLVNTARSAALWFADEVRALTG
ncbi:hypothetical protein FNF29_07272 [Cafeteria roenbergensis]|uniref:PDZ domain-containing protein n=1 Tax=Cafeteria roenbergensis TaxID=33653 RepID=A0A5A8C4E6_CAFRO|nr:hypothetical protein FNF29_07272 [Cafeteria roenbergensis]|eukprot:KAA0147527.1 hypothetical protein FNF29_07272 [Cafeteria roenbergensis]